MLDFIEKLGWNKNQNIKAQHIAQYCFYSFLRRHGFCAEFGFWYKSLLKFIDFFKDLRFNFRS
jgi:hypothetical protein